MRRRQREQAGGDVAMMAVITKAMGAFLVIMLLLLPYYTGDNQNEKTIAGAKATMDNAEKAVEEAAELLSKEHLTSEDIRKALGDLDGARAAWREAQGQIDELKTKLDQYSSQIDRLDRERAQAESAYNEARADLAIHDEAKAVFVLSWSGCLGANIEAYVYSNVEAKSGAAQPQVTRLLRAGFLTTQLYTAYASSPSYGFGVRAWVETSAAPLRRMTFFAKYSNAHPFGNQTCRLHAAVMPTNSVAHREIAGVLFLRGLEDSNGPILREADPYMIIGRYYFDDKGELTREEMSDQEEAAILSALYASPCELLSCFHHRVDPPVEELRRATSASFQAQGLPAPVAEEMATLVTTRRMTTQDAYRRLALLTTNDLTPAANEAPAAGAELERLQRVFEAKSVPSSLASALIGKIRSKNISLALLSERLESLPGRELSRAAGGGAQ